MALCVAVLIASEFMPVSLLTLIAADLGIGEGQAGQAISISGLFAVITSLTVARLTRRIDRKAVQSAFVALLIVSALIVSLAPNYPVLMIGRALLGIAIGGFWSMSTAIVMRLLPADQVPRGLATLQIGNGIASTVSAPLGAWLGDLIGWRGAFALIVPVALLALVWQRIHMPPLPPRGIRRPSPLGLLLRGQVALGMAAIFLLFAGQFALFTYLRPYLEAVTGFSIPMLSAGFLAVGLAGLAGAWTMGRLLRRRLYSLLIGIPAVLAGLALLFILLAPSPVAAGVLIVLWGFCGTAAPVGWGTWLARTFGEDAEAGGGLQVAVIQLAIMAGAASGGFLFDALGWQSTFALSAVLLGSASLFASLACSLPRAGWTKAV
ncbi:Arabinose efflux permease [Rubellimicrobium thermophilum DSM 16684]|uniref:Arabinose efflux permease n=1 Tax=Rubellimicrobium thermophilum DSM 16684 TaxID=1123069 RepID=S9R252_9RHOB|nr:MFS transporter [Rubellimicrobium thermophilum]EPX87741.1 Arabinose efflux permease [Rubellimicrobium thermophilum DSM 16684]